MESNIVEFTDAETPVQLRSEMVNNEAASVEANSTPMADSSSQQPQQKEEAQPPR